MRTVKKRFTACSQCIVSKRLVTDFRLIGTDFISYLKTLCPSYMSAKFYYVFVSEDKVTKKFYYTFIYATKWLQSQSLRQFSVQPCQLVAFYSFGTIGLFI